MQVDPLDEQAHWRFVLVQLSILAAPFCQSTKKLKSPRQVRRRDAMFGALAATLPTSQNCSSRAHPAAEIPGFGLPQETNLPAGMAGPTAGSRAAAQKDAGSAAAQTVNETQMGLRSRQARDQDHSKSQRQGQILLMTAATMRQPG